MQKNQTNKQTKKRERTWEQNIWTDKEGGKKTNTAFTCLSDVPTSQVWKLFFQLQSRKSKGQHIMLARKYISQIRMFWSDHLLSFVHHVPALLLHRINALLNTEGAMNKSKTGVHSQRSGKKTKTGSGKLQHDTKARIPQNKTGKRIITVIIIVLALMYSTVSFIQFIFFFCYPSLSSHNFLILTCLTICLVVSCLRC